MTKDICEVTCINQEKVTRAKNNLTEQNPMDVAKVFKALSDDTRVKIAYALSLEDELCVCDVANIVGSTTATASHHLRLLKNRSEEHTSELQSRFDLVCRLLL